MTHGDIYTKFMIEYDKAGEATSYPSLTKYEIATLLDKAYLAIIAQKLVGNNIRKSGFESDVKAIEDIRPIVVTKRITDIVTEEDRITDIVTAEDDAIKNAVQFKISNDLLYYITSKARYKIIQLDQSIIYPIDIVKLINHDQAQNFVSTSTNIPWIKNPVGYLENTIFTILFDNYLSSNQTFKTIDKLILTYIQTPIKFVNDTDDKVFELSDSMAEELINLAISFALENVESSRLSSKLQTRQLES